MAKKGEFPFLNADLSCSVDEVVGQLSVCYSSTLCQGTGRVGHLLGMSLELCGTFIIRLFAIGDI